MLWLYLYFPKLQLDQLYIDALKQTSLVIIDFHLNEVVQMNDIAKAEGVSIGMGMASTIALCKELNIVEHKTELEQEVLEQLSQELYTVVADLCITSHNGLLIKLSNMLKVYNSISECWRAIDNILKQHKVCYYYALGHSPLTAELLATTKHNQLITEKRTLLKQVGQLSIELLDISKKSKDNLNRIGITFIHQLLTIPLKELAIRFDLELLNTLGKITGEIKTQLNYYQPPLTYDRNIELLYEISNTERLQKPMYFLLNKLEVFLQKRCLTCQTIIFTLIANDEVLSTIKLSSAIAQHRASKWLQLLQLKLESLKLSNPVRNVTLEVKELSQMTPNAPELFSNNNKSSKAEFLSLLRTKLGENNVNFLAYKNEHLPEYRSELTKTEQVDTSQVPMVNNIKYPKPLYILATPTPLKYKVQIKTAAQRLQTNWWQGEMIMRDYYLADNSRGQWQWIFKDHHNKWFIHGYFG